ncbi:zinc finger BED domain-containing protein 5-like [Onthophagus taurus]|uniref:zinc finger BED domain-containing protein 5-like n=1 Tax=Onthophagus taurus TaxID=166361 RepID=UPI0039BDD28F
MSSTHIVAFTERLWQPADLQKVLDESVKIVNYIKGRPLNARLFAQMCEETGSSHTQLLLHTDVRWLFRGKILSRLFKLRLELQVFLNDKFELKKCLHDSTWLSKLAYLADIFSILNGLNLSLQGKDISLFYVQDKVNATIEKLKLWKTRVNNGELDSFPSLHEFVIKSSDKIDTDVLKCLTEHLDGLQEGLKNYFPDLTTNFKWIRQPFNIDSSAMPDNLSNVEQEQLLELPANEFLKNKHKECSLASFWLQMQQLYPNLTEKVLKHVLPFPTSYLCEVAFSALVDIKSKKRNRILDVEPHLRLKLTNREPDHNHQASSQHKQIHPSH